MDKIYRNISDISAAFMEKLKAEEIREKISDVYFFFCNTRNVHFQLIIMILHLMFLKIKELCMSLFF